MDGWLTQLGGGMSMHVLAGARMLAAALAMTGPGGASSGSTNPSDLAGLPLVESPAPVLGDSRLAILISGDGGIAPGDEAMAAALNRRGISVVTLDSRKYLRTARTPAEASHDLARILRHYVPAWGRRDVLIVGYSRGAEIAPFMIDGLPTDVRAGIRLVGLLGPGETANFHFRWIDVVRDVRHPDDVPLLPELERLRGTPVVCAYGSDDRDEICTKVAPTLVHAVQWHGGHVIGRTAAEEIVGLVLADPGARPSSDRASNDAPRSL